MSGITMLKRSIAGERRAVDLPHIYRDPEIAHLFLITSRNLQVGGVVALDIEDAG